MRGPARFKGKWWLSFRRTCPISLEPLYSLAYPPFKLAADPARRSTTDSDWFDGRVLASYFVSTGQFFHPTTRREVTRTECERLDNYLQAYSLGNEVLEQQAVVHAYDQRGEYDTAHVDPASRLTHLRAEADRIMAAIFVPRQLDGRRHANPRRSQTDVQNSVVPSTQQGIVSEGALRVIDDDLVPPSLRVGPTAEVSEPNDFPPLPAATPPRNPLLNPLPTRPHPAMSLSQRGGGNSKAKEPPADKLQERNKMLTDAFSRTPGQGSVFSTSAAARFSPSTLTLARSMPALVQEIELTLDRFLSGSRARESLRPMPKDQRLLVTETARLYNIATCEYGLGDSLRHVDLFRTKASDWPPYRLSDAITTQANTKTAESPCTMLPVVLEQVECTQHELSGCLQSLLHLVPGNYTLTWHEPAPSSGSKLASATLHFSTEQAAQQAREALAGGRRGPEGFRVASTKRRLTLPDTTVSHHHAAGHHLRSDQHYPSVSSNNCITTRVQSEANTNTALCIADENRRQMPLQVGRLQPYSSTNGREGATVQLLQQLTWGATKRVVWSSTDELAAVERLRALGFPLSACKQALQIAGGVSEDTQRAAEAEWLLQHVEALGCDDDSAVQRIEQTSPWSIQLALQAPVSERVPDEEQVRMTSWYGQQLGAASSSDGTMPAWRSRSVLARLARASRVSNGEVWNASLKSQVEGEEFTSTVTTAIDTAVPQPLTWGATRRVVWSSTDELAAIERLRALGFPLSACKRALQIAGGVSEDTQRAAEAEWLLQHVEALGFDDDSAVQRIERTSPWSGLQLSVLNAQAVTQQNDERSVDTGSALTAPSSELGGVFAATDAISSSYVLPRDFLERQPRRWLKAQRLRGIKAYTDVHM